MSASLPMYWRPETAPQWRAFWRRVQEYGTDLPDLTAPEDLPQDWYAHWQDPALDLSMTCGLPFRSTLWGKVAYVGTVDFGLGGPAGHYMSHLVTRPDEDLSRTDLRLAYNSDDSQSGWGARLDGPIRQFGATQATGAHAQSCLAVAEGRADAAYIDAVTWRLLQLYEPLSQRLQVRMTTRPTPGLAVITALGRDVAPLQHAMRQAIASTPASERSQLGGIAGFTVLDPEAYRRVAVPAPVG